MAPYNLSDLAVKEIKLHKTHLSPAQEKSYAGKFLLAHVMDFWALFWVTFMSMSLFQAGTMTYMKSDLLKNGWAKTSFSSFYFFSWMTLSMTYFFMSYYMNHGQTFGMKVMKCRISMNSHCARSSLRWAFMSLSLYFTFGLSFRKGTAMLKNSGKVTAHDHLWQELMRQKEISAPDVRTLEKESEVEQYSEAA